VGHENPFSGVIVRAVHNNAERDAQA
jgi:hypothetical protein